MNTVVASEEFERLGTIIESVNHKASLILLVISIMFCTGTLICILKKKHEPQFILPGTFGFSGVIFLCCKKTIDTHNAGVFAACAWGALTALYLIYLVKYDNIHYVEDRQQDDKET